ncbi:Epididymal secretory protein E1 [Orchesella cincta]|uniref:Epididymal secretory protein E1 n=1 Tax=Orchesella cincta TaxID=48709 RepID=A0A1D2MLK6_ORCCI|nr:Epididymal secretory protein E1 [Orchesella cincta]
MMPSSNVLRLYLFVSVCYCVVLTADGFLSAHPANNFHYTVERVDDVDNLLTSSSDEGTVTSSLKTSYKDCGSASTIKSLSVIPCDSDVNKRVGNDVCEIERGSNVTFNVSFVPKANATQLKAVIHGIYDFVPIPFPCPQPDACQNSGLTCPLQAGRLYDYVLNAKVLEKYPRIKLWVKGQLEDENGNNVICVEIHIRLV